LQQATGEIRRVPVPAHRYTPLRENWIKIFTPLVEHLKLQVRFNTRTRHVELRNSKDTSDMTHLQKGADFVKAFLLGFDVDDAIALLRLDELFLESFEIEDGQSLICLMTTDFISLFDGFFYITSETTER
jgi:RNA-binding protein PNO1